MLLRARYLLAPEERVIPDGGLLMRRGRIERVLTGAAAIRRAERELGLRAVDCDGLLAPGLVDAHAHLELGVLRGVLDRARRGPRATRFTRWIEEIIRARASLRAADYVRGVHAGVRRLLETGTTTVGDIAATSAGVSAPRSPLRAVVFREVLDAWDASRTRSALARIGRGMPRLAARREGVSPHAPYTTSAALLEGVRDVASRRGLPVTIHWAETRAEVAWLADGVGPLAALLGISPGRSGLELIEGAGLLGKSTSLVHGNHPARGDTTRIARAGAVVVHCPGTHAYFGREPFPWKRYRRAGVELALGTDSLASNEDLSMPREMALARRQQEGPSPAEALRMATTAAAAALGLADEVGALRAGFRADLALFDAPGEAAEVLEELTSGAPGVRAVWVGGKRVFGARARLA